MPADMTGRCTGDKKMRIETLGHIAGRDPVREMCQRIASDGEFFLAQHVDEANFAFFQRVPIVLKRG